jgi:RecJ-like exonuclease
MKNKTILSIAIICSLVGIFMILLIVENTELSILKIKNITEKHLETKVKISGEITSIKETPGLLILQVKDPTGKIDVIIFKNKKINITKNIQVEIEGEIQEYKDKLQIAANKITLLRGP